MEQAAVARIAVSTATYAIDKPYDYMIPRALSGKVDVGMRVLVPFGPGGRITEGFVLSLSDSSSYPNLKAIEDVLDAEPILSQEMIRLALWVHNQCFCLLYQVLNAMLPAGLKFKTIRSFLLMPEAELSAMVQACADIDGGTGLCEQIFEKRNEKLDASMFRDKYPLSKINQVFECLCEHGLLSIQQAERNLSDKMQQVARLCVSPEEAEEYMEGRQKRSFGQCEVLRMLLDIGAAPVAELRYFTGASLSSINTLRKNGIIEIVEREVYRRPNLQSSGEREEICLNEDQESVYRELISEYEKKEAACSLLFGVTGSGKTLVYMKLIEHCIDQGKTALMLVPEIALTPQVVERFYCYFGDRIAILHSALSAGERLDEWKRIKTGKVDVVVGTRSAVFAPLENLGIVILDEEQEHTYKSGSNPRYHARDVAKFRCIQNKALLLLGSATPSVESMYQAQIGKYSLHVLENRYNQKPLPKVYICDRRKDLREGNASIIGDVLREELAYNLEHGKQSILFLNRRGASRYVVCETCGCVPECVHCSAPLTYHSANGRLMCHHCGYSRKVEHSCAYCGEKMRFVGCGTQKVEEELRALFPNVGILRMDTDTTTTKDAHERILNRFREENIPILIGTQMITKGLDFENVTLVGVLDADQAINMDHFRAAENAFSLITQVVGRAGRGDSEGRAVIQTYSPNQPVIQFAANQDYINFYKSEILLRKNRGLPPFCDIINVMVSGVSEKDVLKTCTRLLSQIEQQNRVYYPDLELSAFGPAPAMIARINEKYRYQFSLCGQNCKRLREMIASVLQEFGREKMNRGCTVVADINGNDF